MVVLGRARTWDGAASSGICRRVRKRVRSTTPMERESRLATKQYPRKRWALGLVQAAAAAEESSRARREIRGRFTLLF